MQNQSPRRWTAATLIILLAASAMAQQTFPPRELRTTAWQDQAHGISIHPPLGTKLVKNTGDQYLLRIIDEAKQFQITLALRQSRKALQLADVIKSAQDQIKSIQPASSVMGRELKRIGELDGVIIYFQMPQPRGNDALVGQVIAQLDANRFVVMELRCAIQLGQQTIPTFEAVAQSLKVADQQQISARRREAVGRAHDWKQQLRIEDLRKALVPEQFFRLTEKGRDIGYLRIRQEWSKDGVKANPQPGVNVEVQSRMVISGTTLDSRSAMYLSDSDIVELWTTTTTFRQAENTGKDAVRTVTEAGARRGDQISISVNDSHTMKKRNFTYKRPVLGYLSQVESQLLGQLVPRDRASVYGFYWYLPRTNKLTYRSDRITPTLTGYVMTTTLTPNGEPLRSTYDGEGRLLSKQLGGRRELVATTQEKILQRWKTR